jgi:DNA-binding transcriptional ArsR family regulator
MKELERILKSVANKRRLAILKFLKRVKEASVQDIADEIHLSLKSTSKHLGILIAADVLEKEQRRLYVFYRLATEPPTVVKNILAFV